MNLGHNSLHSVHCKAKFIFICIMLYYTSVVLYKFNIRFKPQSLNVTKKNKMILKNVMINKLLLNSMLPKKNKI